MAYLSEERQEVIAEELATLFHEEELLVSFAKRSAELYDTYDEYTADDVLKRVKRKVLQLNQPKNISLILADELHKAGATDIHFKAHNIRHTKGITSVVSVYDNVKPANMVLDELYAWAEKHDESLIQRIEALDRDMSWNDDNPV